MPVTAGSDLEGAGRVASEPVSAVFSRRVKPGCEAQFREWAHGITAAAARHPGHLGGTLLNQPPSPEYHIVYRFQDQATFRAWLDSADRHSWLAKVDQLTESHEDLQQLTGLETWFRLPGGSAATMKPPPRWKMWLVSLIAVYPFVLGFQAFLTPSLATLPLPVRAALFPLVLLTLMTFLVMPVATRLTRRFLYPRRA